MVVELTPGVWWVDLGGTNAYLVDDGGVLTLVDAGLPWEADDVAAAIGAAGYSVGNVERVLVTHYDADHVGGLGRLDDLDADVYAGETDAPLVAGRAKPGFLDRKSAFQRLAGFLVDPPPGPVTAVADGDRIGSFTAYHTPGHTVGHVAYVSERLDVAFLGDLVRESDGRLEPSPWFLSYDPDGVRASIRDFAEHAPDFAVACPGHGRPITENGSDAVRRLA